MTDCVSIVAWEELGRLCSLKQHGEEAFLFFFSFFVKNTAKTKRKTLMILEIPCIVLKAQPLQ